MSYPSLLLFGVPIRRALVAKKQLGRHFRSVTKIVLRWYTELEDGNIQSSTGPVYDSRFLDYRLDVELVLKKFTPNEVNALLYVHRDGLTHAQAIRLSGIPSERPDRTVADIEIRVGQAFERRRLSEFTQYIGYLR